MINNDGCDNFQLLLWALLLLLLEVTIVTGIAANSVFMHKYSPVIAITDKQIILTIHHDKD